MAESVKSEPPTRSVYSLMTRAGLAGRGKRFSAADKRRVQTLLQQRQSEATIERATGVSERTIRRWKKVSLSRTYVPRAQMCGGNLSVSRSRSARGPTRALGRWRGGLASSPPGFALVALVPHSTALGLAVTRSSDVLYYPLPPCRALCRDACSPSSDMLCFRHAHASLSLSLCLSFCPVHAQSESRLALPPGAESSAL